MKASVTIPLTRMDSERAMQLVANFRKKVEHYRYIAYYHSVSANDIEFYSEQASRYSQLINRVFNIGHTRREESMAYKHWKAHADYNNKLNRKASGKFKFESKHQFHPWFESTSLSDKQGDFNCEKCGTRFFHSPSKITKAANEIYSCCCGSCTNKIIHHDWDKTPYT